MYAILASLRHRSEDTPLCPRMVRSTCSDPTDYLCDVPADLRKKFLGETPCSVHAGCVPRQKDPEAVNEAQLALHYRKFNLRASRG